MILQRQEIIEFDPANKEHRAAVRAFMRRRAWVDSPLRFAYDPSYGSVAEQVQAKLLEWYIAQEEAKVARTVKVSKAVAPQIKKALSVVPLTDPA